MKKLCIRLAIVSLVLFAFICARAESANQSSTSSLRRVCERKIVSESEFPDWKSDKCFYLNDLRLLMTSDELGEILGEAGRSIDEGFNVYSDDVIVRLRDGLAVNISVTGSLNSWKLHRDSVTYATIGDSKNQVLKRLGKPFARYRRDDKSWDILVYSSRSSDIGLFMINDQVAGFMLTEPGLLGFSLQYKGFKLIDI